MKIIKNDLSPAMGFVSYTTDTGCSILQSTDNGLFHLSISHSGRYPTWNEIKQARYELLPDEITMIMYLPPKDEFVNVHKNCFHLWQIKQ